MAIGSNYGFTFIVKKNHSKLCSFHEKIFPIQPLLKNCNTYRLEDQKTMAINPMKGSMEIINEGIQDAMNSAVTNHYYTAVSVIRPCRVARDWLYFSFA
ncbi:MAG: hypothetical protein H7122_08730 [Chitinophagaceae bacterium]|nr:hypothetical protein [Chitinophagaceae bacterium]